MKRSYWQDLKGAFYLIWRNKWSFISVGILLQFVVGIGAAALSWVFQLALLLSGASNIDKNNILTTLTNPLSLVALILFAIVFAFLFMLEMRTMIALIYLSRTDQHLSFKKVFRQSFGRLKDFSGWNLLHCVSVHSKEAMGTVPSADLPCVAVPWFRARIFGCISRLPPEAEAVAETARNPRVGRNLPWQISAVQSGNEADG